MQTINCVYPTNGGPALCVPALNYGPLWWLGQVSTCQQHCKLKPTCIAPHNLTTKAARVTARPRPGKPATPAQASARARAHAPTLSGKAMRRNLGHALSAALWARARYLATNPWVVAMRAGQRVRPLPNLHPRR